MNKENLKKKIENILNKYYEETGKEVFDIKTIRVLNRKLNFKFKVEFKEQRVLK
jgi:hypothetical protein